MISQSGKNHCRIMAIRSSSYQPLQMDVYVPVLLVVGYNRNWQVISAWHPFQSAMSAFIAKTDCKHSPLSRLSWRKKMDQGSCQTLHRCVRHRRSAISLCTRDDSNVDSPLLLWSPPHRCTTPSFPYHSRTSFQHFPCCNHGLIVWKRSRMSSKRLWVG